MEVKSSWFCFLFCFFFGSKSIPDVARNLGRGIRQFKDATNDIQRDITNSVNDVKRTIDKDNE